MEAALGVAVVAGATATAQLHRAVRRGRPIDLPAALLVVSGLSPWAPMALAVAWAAARHWAGPALSIPAMVRVHGTLNAIGFVGAGLLARAVEAQDTGAVDRAGERSNPVARRARARAATSNPKSRRATS